MAFNNPAFEGDLPPQAQNIRNTSREGTVQNKYRVGDERDSAAPEDIYEEIPADHGESKYETLKPLGDENGYAKLGKEADAKYPNYQTLGGVDPNHTEHPYASLRNDTTLYDNAVDDPPPYDTITPNYVTVKTQGSFLKTAAFKFCVVVLLCIAVLVGGIIIGLFISGKLGDDDTDHHVPTLMATQTTTEATRTPTASVVSSATKKEFSTTLTPTTPPVSTKTPFSSPTMKSATQTTTTTTTTTTTPTATPTSTTTRTTTTTTTTATVTLPSTPGDPILVAYGAWSQWPSWSDCSQTCGDGHQSRHRQCIKTSSSDLDCPGNDTETRQCNLGNCPDCARTCTGSLIQEDCLSCHCVNTPVRRFRIVNSQTTPLEGATAAKIDVSHKVLATATGDGRIEIKNACIGDVYIFKKDRFIDATVNVSSSTDYVVIMEAMERLEMREHPKDTVAVVGENRALSCLASGKPQPYKYEWFKNGLPLDQQKYEINANVLQLKQLVKQDGGMYSCRATSDYGVALSKSALVLVKDDGDDFCETTPKDYMKTLPNDCPQGGGVFQYNLKRCANNACTKSPPADGASYCCGPTKQEKRQISCNGYQLDVVVTKECGCTICNKINIGAAVATKLSEVTFSGRAFDLLDSSTVLSFGEVYLNGENVGRTGFDGSFSFVVPNDTLRVVLTLTDGSGWFSNGFVNTTKVYFIPTGFTGTFYRDVPMVRTSEVTTLSPSDQNTLTLAKTGTQSPLAEVVIPPNVFFTKDGDQYTGEVKAGVHFIDPRNVTDYENIVGDLTYLDENGQVGGLQTFGMFNLDFKDTSGSQLGIQGDVEMAITADFLGASDPTATTSVKLWSLNPNTGRWELEGTLKRGTAVNGRRKRSQSNYDSTFFIGNVVITDRYWFNFDNDELNYCYVKFKTYTDSSLSAELPWNPDIEPTVIAMDSTQTGQWAQVTTGSMSYDGFTGASSSGDCILTVCGNNKFTGYLMLEDSDGPFRGSSSLGGGPTSPAGVVQLNTTSLGCGTNVLTYDSVINTTVFPLTSRGPIYHTGNSLCYDPSSTFCNYCFTVDWTPTCVLCDSWACQYPASTSYANCIAGQSTSSPHYRFFKYTNMYEYTVCETIFDCENSPDLFPLIWYPPVGNTKWAWYIKVQVEVIKQDYVFDVIRQTFVLRNTTLPDESVVRAISYGGTHSKTDGKIFGIREDVTQQHTTCLEFKGSGDIIYNENGQPRQGTDETFVDMKVQGTNCHIVHVLPGLKAFEQSHSGIFGFKLPEGTISGGDATGIYFNDNADADTAEKVAKARCNCADIQHGSPSCGEYKPNDGVGLKIVCLKAGS